MSENNRKTLLYVLLALCLVLAGLCISSRLHDNRGAADEPGTSIQRAQDGTGDAAEALDRAESANRDAQESAENVRRGNEEIRESVERSGDAISRGESILSEIRKQRKEN